MSWSSCKRADRLNQHIRDRTQALLTNSKEYQSTLDELFANVSFQPPELDAESMEQSVRAVAMTCDATKTFTPLPPPPPAQQPLQHVDTLHQRATATLHSGSDMKHLLLPPRCHAVSPTPRNSPALAAVTTRPVTVTGSETHAKTQPSSDHRITRDILYHLSSPAFASVDDDPLILELGGDLIVSC